MKKAGLSAKEKAIVEKLATVFQDILENQIRILDKDIAQLVVKHQALFHEYSQMLSYMGALEERIKVLEGKKNAKKKA